MTQGEPAAFISYSHHDSKFVLRLARDLKAAGVNVWLDKFEMEAGQLWPVVVQEALTDCPCVLVVMSPSSVESPRAQEEVFFAVKEGKKVIPVFYRDCKPPYQLSALHYADFRTNYALGFKELVRALTPRKSRERSTPAISAVPNQKADQAAGREQSESENNRVPKQARKEDSRERYFYDASVNALSGELTQPIRQSISPQGFLLLRGDESFLSHTSRGYSLEWLVSFAFARTHVAGSGSSDGWNTLANATVEKLNLFDVVTADRVVAQIAIDRPRDMNSLPTVSFLGTTFDNLRIGGRPVQIELEAGTFRHGGICLPASKEDKPKLQGSGRSHDSLVRTMCGNVPTVASRNSMVLPGFGTVFLGELLVDRDSYQLKMIRLETSSGGEITVATCRAGTGLSEWEARHRR